MCFHKYELKLERNFKAEIQSIFKSLNGQECLVLCKIYKCKKCGKLKGYKFNNSNKIKIDPSELFEFKMNFKEL